MKSTFYTVILFLSSIQISAQCLMDYGGAGTQFYWSLINNPSSGVSQQVIMECSGDLTSIWLQGWVSAGSIQIRSGNNPNGGTVLYDEVIANGEPVNGTYTLTTPVPVVNGQSYVVRVVGNFHSGSLAVGNFTYGLGTFWYTQNGGSSWSNYNSADLKFDIVISSPAPSVINWDGTNSTDWNTAANWSDNAVPGSTDDVVIPNVANDPVIPTGNFEINDVEIESGATLQVASGGSLTLNGELNNSGSVTIQDGGSFLQGTGSSVTGSGTFSVQRQGSSLYNMWSSPIANQNGVPGSSYLYNPSLSTQDDSDDSEDPGWVSHNGTMTPGVGYAGLGGGLATFTGVPNNGNVSQSLYYTPFDNTFSQTTPGTPFNLVGNPYPSAISAANFVSTNTDLSGTIYFWNDNGSNNYSRTDYAMWNGTGSLGTGGGPVPNGFIGTAQGFMVRALNGGASANFANSMRVTGNNTQFHRQSGEDSRMWFSVENDDLYNEILIGLLEDATNDEDRMYDAVKLKGNPDISLSAVDATTEYAILAFPPPMEERTIPLRLDITTSGIYTFTANTMENLEGYNVTFTDILTGATQAVVEGEPINVSIEAGEHVSRFYLNLTPSQGAVTGVQDLELNSLNLYPNPAEGQVNWNSINAQTAIVMDNTGRVVLNVAQPNGGLDISDLTNGIYVLLIQTAEGVYTSRLVKK